jgi:hypothetical protein
MESRHSANKVSPYFSRSQISLNPTLPSLPIPALYLKIEMHRTTQLASAIDGKNAPYGQINYPCPSVFICG